ncbi:PIR Superfamily Protein [Plasmodium ovale curtisi]|uniref:PIR Superfamily Protein n=2 Tax=Plasmodium ovale TaxID=36330 RepID=A0A1A8WNI3_PLAOA|nr:PIR Superfamily Protein [Plasmodium ovale curtisi]
MPTKPNPTDFLALLQNSTKELNSEKFYDALERDSSDLSKYNEKCNELRVRTKNDEVNIICTKFLRYLKNCEVLNNGSYKYDVSRLLNYWVYEKLINIYGADNTEEIRLGFSKLQYAWSYQEFYPKKNPYYEKCKPNLDMVNHNDWKNRKELYDYCINYEFIAPMCPYFDDACTKHCEYINGKSELYKHFESVCPPKGSDCPEFYDNCKKYHPNIVFNALKCHEKIKIERDADPGAGSLRDSPGSESEPGADRVGPRSPGLPAGSDTSLRPETTHIGTKVGQSVLGVAPVLLTAAALYRYTPIGSWVRNLGGINQNSISNMGGEEMEGFLGNTQESSDMSYGDSGNYIWYQPM